MLTVAKVTANGAGGYAEYLDGRAEPTALGDYYLKDGERVEAPGRWAGGADWLGCDADLPVTGEVLRELMAVRNPRTGHALRPVGGNGEAVAALDATFSSPKSVSEAWALADSELRERIEAAHEQAIDRALHYATRTVAMVRERLDRQTVERRTPTGLIATSWRHTTARAVADRPPDPQLHSHVLLHGAMRGDGRVVAIDSRAWLVHRRELGAAYRTELAHELNRLGFAIQRGTGRGGRYFEIEGIPAELVDRWSSRHHQVKEAIDARVEEKRAALGELISAGGPGAREAAARLERLQVGARLSAAEDRLLTTATRSPKTALVTHADLDRHWAQTARAVGLDGVGVDGLRSERRPPAAADDRVLLSRLTEFDATFSETEARAVALEASAGVSIRGALWRLAELRHEGEVIGLRDGRETTWAHRDTERETVAAAERLAGGRVTPIAGQLVVRETAKLDAHLRRQGGGLADEQHEVLALACSDRQLVVIEGHAGTGKSTVLSGIARSHQAGGRQIITTSTAALAAQRLAADLQQAGVDASPYSTAAFTPPSRAGTLT